MPCASAGPHGGRESGPCLRAGGCVVPMLPAAPGDLELDIESLSEPYSVSFSSAWTH